MGGTVEIVVVVVGEPDAESMAMMGRMGDALGAVVVEPDVATLSLG